MSTVPKLTYAKIGKGPKGKAESVSSQLLRKSDQKSDDLFSHMNQDNLKYIKKELKLKKNRSDQQRPNSPLPDRTEPKPPLEEQLTHRDKLYHKYRGEEEVSEKEPHLEETQRRSDSAKPIPILLPLDIDEEYLPSNNNTSRPPNREPKVNSSPTNAEEVGFVRNGRRPALLEDGKEAQNKMYQSLPQDEGKKRMASIDGFFGEAMSTNLNRHEGAQFIQFLEEYISDLNHSKHLNSRQNEDVSIDKKQREEVKSSRTRQQSREKEPKNNLDQELKESLKKLDRLKRNSDTFGQPNSKFTLNSEEEIAPAESRQLEQLLKEQKLNSLCLAKEVERLRKLIGVKDDIIKSLEINNELMKEEIMHIKIQQEILNKSKKFTQSYSNNNLHPQKSGRIPNEEPSQGHTEFADSSYHHRHASTNPQRPAMSYRSTFKPYDQFPELFQEFAPAHPPAHTPAAHKYQKSREKKKAKKKEQSDSLQKLKREYDQFLADSTRHLKYRRRKIEEVF